MPRQFQPALLYFMLFGVQLGVKAFPASRTVQSRQEYSYIATVLAICFLLALLFFAKKIYLFRCRRKQLSSGVGTKYQTHLDFSSLAAPHSTTTSTHKSAFLVGLLGSPSWETRNSVIFDKVSSYIPFSRPYSFASSSPRNSSVSLENNDSPQICNCVRNAPLEKPLVQSPTHAALLSCGLRDHDSDPAISLDNSTEANPFSSQMSSSAQPQKMQSPMLYDKDTAMQQICGLDFSYKLLPSSLGSVITSPKPALLYPRQVRPQLCLQDPQVNQISTNPQTDTLTWSSPAPKIRARNCEIAVPIGFVPPKTVLPASNSKTLVSKPVTIGKESTGLPCIATQTLQNAPSFYPTGKCDTHQKPPLHLLENLHGNQYQFSVEETDAPRLTTLRPLKFRSPTERARNSPKPGPSPLRTMFLPPDDCENSVVSRHCDQDCTSDNLQISGSPDQGLCVVPDEHALPPSSVLWDTVQSVSSTSGATRHAHNTRTRPLNRFKINAGLQDKLIGLLLEELVNETSDWDDSLFINNNFKAMIDSSKSCGALEMQPHTRKKTNPRVSHPSSFSRLEDIPELNGRNTCVFEKSADRDFERQ